MSSSTLRRLIVVLALGAFLGAPATSSAGSSLASRHPLKPAAVQQPLSRLWNALMGPWEKEGCRIDPNGRCLAGQATPEIERPGASAGPSRRPVTGR
jgi:hypothetical protein